MISARLDQLANFMIRPRRRPYNDDDLGPSIFKSKYGLCQRQDFQVPFRYGQTYGYQQQPQSLTCMPTKTQLQQQQTPYFIKGSIFTPIHTHKHKSHHHSSYNSHNKNCYSLSHSQQRICVLAMHGNTGSRMSTISLLQPVLKYGLSFAIFDFIGCGNSDGEHVTLGYSQKHQISAVLQYILKIYGNHRFILHGRSMGAASALFYCSQVYPLYVSNKYNKITHFYQKYPQNNKNINNNLSQQNNAILQIIKKLNHGQFGYEIVGLIIDSPYYDTKLMFQDLLAHKLWFVPKFIVNYVMNIAHQRAKSKLVYMAQKRYKNNAQKQQKQVNSTQNNIKQNNNIFSLLDDIKIPKQCQLPFPVFMIYGLNDDVISKKHTCELFKKLICENKKLHIIQDQGHGGHRDDQLKMNALQWILGYQWQRISHRVMRDAEMLQMTVDQYIRFNQSSSLHTAQQKQKYNYKSKQKQHKEKQKQKSTQIATQRTFSYGQLNNPQANRQRNEYFSMGSLTSLDNASHFSQNCKTIDKYQNTKFKKMFSCQTNHDQIKQQIYEDVKSVTNDSNFNNMKKVQKAYIKNNKQDQAKDKQSILQTMSRINPFKILKKKIGVQESSFINGQCKKISCKVMKLEQNNERDKLDSEQNMQRMGNFSKKDHNY